jgi:hypothetical protein
MVLAALGLGWVAVRAEGTRRARWAALGVAAAAVVLGGLAHHVRREADLTEEHRASLPPAVERSLKDLPGPLRIEVNLDRDDARRHQLENDLLSKLRIARSDIDVIMSADTHPAPIEAERDPTYGKIIVQTPRGRRETYSTSRKELVTLFFEASGLPVPNWDQPTYPGYPLVLEGTRRSVLLVIAYLALPLALLAIGLLVTRARTGH